MKVKIIITQEFTVTKTELEQEYCQSWESLKEAIEADPKLYYDENDTTNVITEFED